MSQSLWREFDYEKRGLPQFPKLQGRHKTDVLIIGGGLCGVLCAWFLEQAGVDYMLVEADTIGSGMTGNTTAKLTSQHNLIYGKLLHLVGKERAAQYLRANEEALSQYRILAEMVDCDFEEKDAFVYTRSDRKKIEDEVEAVNALGFSADFRETLALPFPIKGAICFPGQAQFHPMKFLTGIAKGLNIYEHTFVQELAPHTAYIGAEPGEERGEICADQIIVATHFPFLNKHGGYFLKLYQHRSYVLGLEGAQEVAGMYLDESQEGLSFRNYGNLLLLGGGSHRTGAQGGGWQELRRFANQYYAGAKEKYAWAAQDCMSLDGIPYIGAYSRRTAGLYVASGFGKWGMTSSMVAAKMLCDLVTGKEPQYRQLYDPARRMKKSQLFLNGTQTAVHLLTPSLRRCPHLGCALKWNPQEHSWDCPCHGSRFEEDGMLIDNPATGDAASLGRD